MVNESSNTPFFNHFYPLANKQSGINIKNARNQTNDATGYRTIKSSARIGETFIKNFIYIGPDLAKEIPHTDISPESFLEQATNHKQSVCQLLSKLNKKNAMGLDKIPTIL